MLSLADCRTNGLRTIINDYAELPADAPASG